MTGLPPLCGHDDLRARLQRTAAAGRLPQSLLLHGPDGAGKQRLGLWLAALVLCESDGPGPCGVCPACSMVGAIQHPDFHWFFPVPSPRGSHTPRKRRELLEETRREWLDERRRDPFWIPPTDRSPAIFLAMVDEIRLLASRRPAIGRSSVFLIGDADRMVPQASSPEAANAFLKLLEEPPPDTLIVMTSSRPGSLLPTVRSRSLSVRVTLPGPEETAAFLVREAGMAEPVARTLARRSQGALGRALRLADAEPTEAAEGWHFVRTALEGSFAERCALAASFPPSGARGPFSDTLDRIEEVLRECITRRLDSVEFMWHTDVDERLPELAGVDAKGLLGAVDCLEGARTAAAGNGNPQAIASVLLSGMARELRSKRPAARNARPGGG